MKEKMEKESNIIKLSVFLSALFLFAEILMAIFSKSKALLMDCMFGSADLIIILIISFLLPLIYKPVTEKRPYGYSQVESVLIILKGVSVFIITLFLIIDNIEVLLSGGSELDLSWIVICQLLLEAFCILAYVYLKMKCKKFTTPVIEADLIAWKIDVFTMLGMFLSFLVQFLIKFTPLYFISSYIDSVVAIIISVIMIREPIKMVIESFKNLILFAPEKETVEEIKCIVDKRVKKYSFKVTFYDVVKTGRKMWVELYIKSSSQQINIKELKAAKSEIEGKLKEEFGEIYVEFTPEL